MNIVVYSSRGGKPRSLHISKWWQGVLAGTAVLGLFGVVAAGGFWLGTSQPPETYVTAWEGELQQQREEVETLRAQAQSELGAMAARLGQMQGHVTRLDALGSRLVAMADIDASEFQFVEDPAVGGPEDIEDINQGNLDTLEQSFQALDAELQSREAQLSVLEEVLAAHNLNKEVHPKGRPIVKGWLSSNYGWRTNPFGGNKEFHKGIDFAGKEDSDILSVAGGVVTWSGRRYGYGNLVEITHGNGYITRYGHNKKNLVKEGEAVKKGQVLAKMGSTGRSTGPHVHFEVLKNGKKINPLSFIADN